MADPVAETFDHFVVPVDDLVAAEDFYTRVFGGEIVGRNGLNVQHRKRGAVPHTFIRIAGKRIGVYLQSEERSMPVGARGSPTYSFETTEPGLQAELEQLETAETVYEGPIQVPAPLPRRSVFFTDPAGNHFDVYVPAESAHEDGQRAGPGWMVAVGYLNLEAPALEDSVRFYERALGFEVVGFAEGDGNGAREATLRLPGAQLLTLTEVPASPKGLVMSRTVPGPHIAFYVPAARWAAAVAHLDALGIPHGDRGAAKVRRPGEGGTYMDDPAGNVIQLITDGME